MKANKITIVDYGMGNLFSVRKALEYCGATVQILSDPDLIDRSDKVVLPGVGAFSSGIKELTKSGINAALYSLVKRGTPLFGICLGMQMLFDSSEEHGDCQGLGILHGKILPVKNYNDDGEKLKIPHIGWNELCRSRGRYDWTNTLLEGIKPYEAVYFVHSFMAKPLHRKDILAISNYCKNEIVAVVEHENIFGCQFHPEKSGQVGLKVLRKFIEL